MYPETASNRVLVQMTLHHRSCKTCRKFDLGMLLVPKKNKLPKCPGFLRLNAKWQEKATVSHATV